MHTPTGKTAALVPLTGKTAALVPLTGKTAAMVPLTGKTTGMVQHERAALTGFRARIARERLIRQQQMLEDAVLRRMRPREYERILRYVENHGGVRRGILDSMVLRIGNELPSDWTVYIASRIKHLYSIYCKEMQTGKEVSDFFDLLGIRLICEDESQCYTVAERLHSLYTPVGHRYKDYIATPKRNGYRSIHTTVVGPNDTPVECQIRTVEMHIASEATHGNYKRKDIVNGNN